MFPGKRRTGGGGGGGGERWRGGGEGWGRGKGRRAQGRKWQINDGPLGLSTQGHFPRPHTACPQQAQREEREKDGFTTNTQPPHCIRTTH